MKRRIYLNFIGLVLPLIIVMSTLLCLLFYNALRSREINSVRDSADLVAEFMNLNATGNLFDYIAGSADTLRMTVISPEGTVLLDNKAVAEAMENHADRMEIIEALRTGTGEAMRYSNTLMAETYYYAVQLNDGNVLRMSKTVGSIFDVFSASLTVILFLTAAIMLLANYLARRLTSNIVKPLSHIDFDGDNTAAYEELLPYVKKIDHQKSEIAEQIAALKNRADTTEAITGSMKEGLILIDKTGSVLTANKSARDVFGIEDMVHKNILHICRDMEFRRGVTECLAGVNTEITFESAGRIHNIFFSPVRYDEEIGGGVILFFDITERYEAEKQRREFSANVSHELKTPLTTIIALSEMIENGMAKEDDTKSFAEKISGQAKRLVNVIDDIIRLSEFDENKITKESVDFDLNELTESVIDNLRENAEHKNVAIKIAGERISINANRQMLDELLYNLVDNAIKYNKESGSVTVTLERENGFCKIAVADTGIGIPAEQQSRVFERFYRVDKSRSKKTGGTGLGLSIVKHIARHHGGSVELSSKEGAGTTVICRIEG